MVDVLVEFTSVNYENNFKFYLNLWKYFNVIIDIL